MPQRNVELLEATLKHITDHPEQHDQTSWARTDLACGTAACFAGWACELAGYQLDLGHNWDAYCFVNGRREGIRETAQALLGLSNQEASTLFCGGNELIHLEMMVKDLVTDGVMRDRLDYWGPQS